MSIRERGHRASPRGVRWLILVLFLCLPGRCFSQTVGYYDGFRYTNYGTSVTIGGYRGPGGTVTIPYSIPGIGTVTALGSYTSLVCTNHASLTITIPGTVTSIGPDTFEGCSSLTNVTIANGVTSILEFSFMNSTNLISAYFQGNPPSTFGIGVFYNAAPGFSIYYPSAAAGWTTPTWKGYRAQPYSFQLPVPSLIQGLGAVTPSFSDLQVGTKYQLRISFDLKTWFAGPTFLATNTSEVYPQPFTRKCEQLFFLLDSAL